MLGKDWTHLGVASLYTNIEKNGYRILYLTSRSLGQASSTREYLDNIRQGDCKLPVGPVIMSPDRLFTSFHREVILRKPHEFKMNILRRLRSLFGNKNPFYAGFGNRITVGIIFIIIYRKGLNLRKIKKLYYVHNASHAFNLLMNACVKFLFCQYSFFSPSNFARS